MQTTHLQQPDHILSLNERHTTHNTSVLRESQIHKNNKNIINYVFFICLHFTSKLEAHAINCGSMNDYAQIMERRRQMTEFQQLTRRNEFVVYSDLECIFKNTEMEETIRISIIEYLI